MLYNHAHRMIGTLAHPLNQAVIDPETMSITSDKYLRLGGRVWLFTSRLCRVIRCSASLQRAEPYVGRKFPVQQLQLPKHPQTDEPDLPFRFR